MLHIKIMTIKSGSMGLKEYMSTWWECKSNSYSDTINSQEQTLFIFSTFCLFPNCILFSQWVLEVGHLLIPQRKLCEKVHIFKISILVLLIILLSMKVAWISIDITFVAFQLTLLNKDLSNLNWHLVAHN